MDLITPSTPAEHGEVLAPNRVPTERAFQLLQSMYAIASEPNPSAARSWVRALLHDEGNLTPDGLRKILEHLSPTGRMVELRGAGEVSREIATAALLGGVR